MCSNTRILDRCQDTCQRGEIMMNTKTNTKKMTITALLTAIAILIPMVMPIKVIIGPASYTLASHVPIFLAMFLSPSVALIVALGATFGFFVAGFPIVIVLRALSHVVFALVGSYLLKKNPDRILGSFGKSQLLSVVVALLHAIGETIIVSIFFFGGLVSDTNAGFLYSVFLLVGVGTFIHSIVDFLIAQYVWKGVGSRMTNMLSPSY